MSKALVSLCLFGAALSVANTLTFSRSQCPSGGTEVAAADKNASAAQPGAVKIAQAKTPQAPKAMDPAPAPKDVDVTGSVDQTDKAPRPQGEEPAPVSQAQAGEVKARPAKVENEPEEWAEVSLAAKVHDAPSVSAPTVRLYGVGTKLRVIGRAPGWIKVVDPTTSKEGWIYEKYLTPREGPDQKQAGLPQPSQRQAALGMPNDVNVSAPTQPEPDARSKRLRKYGWKWPLAYRPPIGFAFRVW